MGDKDYFSLGYHNVTRVLSIYNANQSMERRKLQCSLHNCVHIRLLVLSGTSWEFFVFLNSLHYTHTMYLMEKIYSSGFSKWVLCLLFSDLCSKFYIFRSLNFNGSRALQYMTTRCSAEIIHVFQSSRCEPVNHHHGNHQQPQPPAFKLQIDLEIKDFLTGDRICISCFTHVAETLVGMSADKFARLNERRSAESFNGLLFKCFEFVLVAEPRLYQDHTYRVRLIATDLKAITTDKPRE